MAKSRILPFFIVLAALLHPATTYVIMEGDKEVGRWIDPDGKRKVVKVEEDKAASLKAGRPVAVKPVGDAWFYDAPGYAKAAELTAGSGKPVLLYFHATWCPYCKKLEREVLANPKVKAYLKDVIKVKIDAEKEERLSEKYSVTSYPRLFMANLKAGTNTRLRTSVTPSEFIRQAGREGLKN